MKIGNRIPVITGGIGSGKSTLAEVFKEKGFEVISADDESKLVTEKMHPIIASSFGIKPMEYTEFKKELADIVFKDDKARKKLEKMVHPQIKHAINEKIRKFKNDKIDYIVEMPTFFENKGLKSHNEYFIILVVSEVQDRIRRIIARNSLSFEDAVARVKCQMSDLPKTEFADTIIFNDKIEEYIEKCYTLSGNFIEAKQMEKKYEEN